MEENDSINILSLFIAIRRRWLMVVLIIGLSLLAAFLITLSIPPIYASEGYIRIGLVGDRITETPIMIKCYLDTPESIKKIAESVKLDYSEIEGNLKVDLIQNPDKDKTIMQVIKITARASDPNKAAQIVDSAMTIVESYTNDKYVMWEKSFKFEMDRILKAADQMFVLMNHFLPAKEGESKEDSWFFSSVPTNQYTAEAQGLAVGNGMMAQAEMLRLESEWLTLYEQRTEPTTRRVNPIPPPEPIPGMRLLIIGLTGLISLVVSLGLVSYLYSQDLKKS
jgi:hypothetical protein